MTSKDEIRVKPKLELLMDDQVEEFNRLVVEGKPPDLRNANLAGLDLRRAKLRGLDLSGCYMRGANLSGVDLTGCNLRGASIKGANISGTLFPEEYSAQEIRLSMDFGTRMRPQKMHFWNKTDPQL